MSEEKPEDPPAAAAQEATEDKEDEDSSPPTIDLTHHDIKPDMFEGIHVLDEKFEKIEGAPNFRHLNDAQKRPSQFSYKLHRALSF